MTGATDGPDADGEMAADDRAAPLAEGGLPRLFGHELLYEHPEILLAVVRGCVCVCFIVYLENCLYFALFGLPETTLSVFATEYHSDEQLFCATCATRPKLKTVKFDLSVGRVEMIQRWICNFLTCTIGHHNQSQYHTSTTQVIHP